MLVRTQRSLEGIVLSSLWLEVSDAIRIQILESRHPCMPHSYFNMLQRSEFSWSLSLSVAHILTKDPSIRFI